MTFIKNTIPWNKGTKNICKPNSGSFKKGHLPSHFKGRRMDDYGYVLIYAPNHPRCAKNKMIKEHRLVMEKHLNRYLTNKEVVHHINGKKNDNRIENLKLFKHQGEHLLIDHPRQKKCNTSTKRECSTCHRIKNLNIKNFYRCKNSNYGFGYTCIPCNKIRFKNYRK